MRRTFERWDTQEEQSLSRPIKSHPLYKFKKRSQEGDRKEQVLRNSPVGESASNGRVESAIKRITGQIRTIRDALQAKTKTRLPIGHPVFEWLVEWSAGILNRYAIRPNGKTAFEIMGIKRAKDIPIAEFGEKVLYMPIKTEKRATSKAEPRMHEGIWMGLRQRTNEALIGTNRGVIRARTIRRMTDDARWDGMMLLKVRGTPRRQNPRQDCDAIPVQIDNDGESMVDIRDEDNVDLEGDEKDGPIEVPIERNVPEAPVTRRMYVTRNMVDTYGATEGCPGCRAVTEGGKTKVLMNDGLA